MKRISAYLYICCSFAAILCCISCYDDKGNYDYQEINELKLSGLEEEYTIRVGDPITIIPDIEENLPGKEEDYSYEWIWMFAQYKGKNYNALPWSNLRVWKDFTIGLPAGKYTFYYRVRDNKTGIVWMSDNFTINILNDIAGGFFILSDVNNVGRLDFINYYKDTLYQRLDILASVGAEMPPLDNPLKVVCCNDYNSPYMGAGAVSGENYYLAAILTENGCYRLHPSTLLYEDRYNITDNFLINTLLPGRFYAKDILSFTTSSGLTLVDNNNNLYTTYRIMRIFWTAGIYTNKTATTERPMNVSPKAVVFSSSGEVIAFDTDSLSFAKQTSSTATTMTYLSTANEQEFEYDSEKLLFKFQNTGKELVYLTFRTRLDNFTGVPIYTILKDPATQEYFFGCFSHQGVQQYYHKLKNLPELSEAKEFAMTYNAGGMNYANEFLYYRTDEKIYAYNILNNTASQVYPNGADQSAGKISHFSFIKYNTWQDHLAVCTYDPDKPADSCGKMQVMKVTPVQGTLSVAEHNNEKLEWTGFGKIIDIGWKSK